MPGISHLVMRLDGLIGANQTWSINPKFEWPPGDGSIPTLTVMDGWADQVANHLGAVNLLPVPEYMSSAVAATGVTCSFVNNAGVSVVIAKQVLSTPVAGTNGAVLPPQSAVTASLQTNVPGRRSRGRLYLPLLGAGISTSTLRLSSTTTTNVAQGLATWLQALEDAWPGPEAIRCAVISSVGGTATPVVRVAVGDVVDTQRRRRDQFQEAFVTAPLT